MRNDLGTEYAPSQHLIDNGEDVFYGRVLSGPWIGYDIEVQVMVVDGNGANTWYLIVAEYSFNDEPANGDEFGPPDRSFSTIEEFWSWVTPHPVQWRPR